ncbi:MAG TPA: copper chaperone PCu(A)C [Sphingomicrobium sp.]|nr:copper chaperone PCu(A)C [Sphingomicrobium sp.]
MRHLLLIAAFPALAACQAEPAITVTDATIAAGPRSAAVYATIINEGGADRLVGIEVDGRAPIALHQTSNAGGVMRMRGVDTLDVPANGRLKLESSGAHGMAMGRIQTDPPAVPLTFRFANSPPVSVRAAVTGPGGTAQQP